MKVQIRKSVFETNSSSMHSLAIYNGSSLQNKYYTRDELREEIERYVTKAGVFNGKYREVFYNKGQDDWYFGRHPLYILTTFVEKFAYAYASLGNKTILEEIIKEYCPKIKSIHWPKEYGLDEDNGIVPNLQAYDYQDCFIKDLKDFLLDKTQWVISDGDEYALFDKLLATGIFKDSLITRPDNSPWFNEEDEEDNDMRTW